MKTLEDGINCLCEMVVRLEEDLIYMGDSTVETQNNKKSQIQAVYICIEALQRLKNNEPTI